MSAERDDALERGLVGRTLAYGTRLSGALIAAGVLAQTLSGRGSRLAAAGIVLLVATPYLRVLMMTGIFLRQRERRMAAVSAAVLALMVFGAFFGMKG